MTLDFDWDERGGGVDPRLGPPPPRVFPVRITDESRTTRKITVLVAGEVFDDDEPSFGEVVAVAQDRITNSWPATPDPLVLGPADFQ